MLIFKINTAMKQQTDQHYRWKIIGRVTLAIIGGYILTNLTSILIYFLLPLPKSDAVMTAMLLSFSIYTGVVIWVFSMRSLRSVFWMMASVIFLMSVVILTLQFFRRLGI